MADVIDLADDDSPHQTRGYNVVEEVDAVCASCRGQTKNQSSIVLKLSRCGHTAHYECCPSSSVTSGDTPNKRRKSSPSRGVSNTLPSYVCCPVCMAELDWRDHALACDREKYLGIGAEDGVDQVDAELHKSLEMLINGWHEMEHNGKPAKRKANRAKKKSHAAAASAKRVSGVGYGGSGSERISDQAMAQSRKRQAMEDEKMIKFLQVLQASFKQRASKPWHPQTERLIRTKVKNVSLIPLLSSYLRNGPTDVIARVALYRELLFLVYALSEQAFFLPLLVSSREFPDDEASNKSKKISESVETSLLACTARLAEGLKSLESDAVAQELSKLSEAAINKTMAGLPDHPHLRAEAQNITGVIRAGRSRMRQKQSEAKRLAMDDSVSQDELTKAYKDALSQLQFRAIALVDLCSKNMMAHTFVRNNPNLPGQVAINEFSAYGGGGLAGSTMAPDASKLHRVRKELASLKSSMPLEWSSSVFCVVDETRPDVIQFMIVGPEGTPYQNGLFVFDCLLGPSFPDKPPLVRIQTTGGGRVRFNPNLYKDGKVCLSLLGTWDGPGWDPKTSTLLQVLVSIQSLIMVPDPYFNEPGYENSMGTASGTFASNYYNANIRYHTLRLGMTQMMQNPPYAFREIVKTHFVSKQREITKQLVQWREEFVKLQTQIASTKYGYATFQPMDQAGARDVPTFDAACMEVRQALFNNANAGSVSAKATIDLLDDEDGTSAGAAAAASAPGSTNRNKSMVPIGSEVIDIIDDDVGGMKPFSSTTAFYHDDDDFDDDSDEDAEEESSLWYAYDPVSALFNDDDEGGY